MITCSVFNRSLFALFVATQAALIDDVRAEITVERIAPRHATITVHIPVKAPDLIVHKTLNISSNNPQLAVQSWSCTPPPRDHRDRNAQETLSVHDAPFTCTITCVPVGELTEPTALTVQYFTLNGTQPHEEQVVLPFTAPSQASAASSEQRTPDASSTMHGAASRSGESTRTPHNDTSRTSFPSGSKSVFDILYERLHRSINDFAAWTRELRASFSAMLTTTQSIPLQLLLALLLGLLMSLTPCIYPMIPVTAGLLGANREASVWRNFMLAMSYTAGLATVFAVLGLSVVFVGSQCGQLACNPWVVGTLIALLAYAGGSMFGWYELWIPSLFQGGHQTRKAGSFLSAFAFGAATGTVASPCMSPGLALILSIVPTLGSYVLGFFLLFAFGVGSSIPLLIVGTFSGSLHLLPRSGMWMMEVKKVFGYLLFMSCFYYAQAIVQPYVALLGASVFTLICCIRYLVYLLIASSTGRRLWAFIASFVLLVTSAYLLYVGLAARYAVTHIVAHDTQWSHSYDEARAQAMQDKKLLLLDFTAQWCSLCMLLEKQILHTKGFGAVLDAVVGVRVDGTERSNEQYARLIAAYKVVGLPTLLLVDPADEHVIARWGSELLDETPEAVRDLMLTAAGKDR